MKSKLPIIAILAVSSQFALADAANDPSTEAAVNTPANSGTQGAAVTAPADVEETTTSTLPPLKVDLGSRLQSKLDARMEVDLVPGTSRENEVASAH